MSDFGSSSSPMPRSPTSRKIWANRFRGADSDDLARVHRFDLAQDSEMISPTIPI